MLLVNFNTTNFAVDIADNFEAKVSAIKAHPSQFGDFSVIEWLRSMAQKEGTAAGYTLAEGFVRIDIQ